MPSSWMDTGKEVRFSTTEKTAVPSGLRPSAYEDALFESDGAGYYHGQQHQPRQHQQYNPRPYPALPIEKEERKLRRICGLSRPWFLVLICAFIFVAAVTGTIGGIFVSKAKSKPKEQPNAPPNDQGTPSGCDYCDPTPTTTSTSYSYTSSISATPTPDKSNSSIPRITNLGKCPFINGTEYISTSNGQSYVKVCGVYWDEGDLYQPHATSFDDCINTCGQYNDQKRQQQSQSSGVPANECHAVGWKTSASSCWLKSGTRTTNPIGADAEDVQSALLRDHWSDW